MADDLLETLGRYQVKSRLGSGAAGIVYKASDPLLERTVAIKVPRPGATDEMQRLTQRFYHEARIAGQLHHPHIVTIHDVGRDHALDFLVMEYVPGQALDQYIQHQGALPITIAVDILYKCCLALDYIHFNHILHRDLKPANIMVNPALEVVKLMDFSIAERIERIERMDALDRGAGTPAYMAPELHSDGVKIGVPSEIFALGLILYEMLAGKPAFRGDTVTTTIYQLLNTEPTALRKVRPEVPPAVEAVVKKAMQKKPQARYQSALELADALVEAMHSFHASTEDPQTGLYPALDTKKQHYSLLRREFWFSNFAPDQVNELLEAGYLQTFQDEEIIVVEGDQSTLFYILLKGEARVIKGQEEVGHLNKGECFGEMGYLSNEARTATIIAVGETIVWVVDPHFMTHLSPSSQLGFYKTFTQLLIKRLTAATQDLAITKSMLLYLSQS